MALVALDSNPVIWGIKKQCSPGQELDQKKGERLVKRLEKSKHTILLPAPVVSEISCLYDLQKQRIFIAGLDKKFEIGYFDAKAMLVLTELLNYNYKIAIPSYKDLGIRKKCMQYDAFIASIAIARNAECIFTKDVDDFKAIVNGRIEIKGMDEMPSSDDMLDSLRNEQEEDK